MERWKRALLWGAVIVAGVLGVVVAEYFAIEYLVLSDPLRVDLRPSSMILMLVILAAHTTAMVSASLRSATV